MKTRGELIERILKLAALASSPSENEASVAALQACVLLREHEESLFVVPQTSSPGVGWVPEKPSQRSVIHEAAAKFMEWRKFVKDHELNEMRAMTSGLCAACGRPFVKNSAVVQRAGIATTHQECAGWWWNFDFPFDDGDIPF
jgi:hypothetical protein